MAAARCRNEVPLVQGRSHALCTGTLSPAGILTLASTFVVKSIISLLRLSNSAAISAVSRSAHYRLGWQSQWWVTGHGAGREGSLLQGGSQQISGHG